MRARLVDEDLFDPDLPRLIKCIEDDLPTMTPSVLETTPDGEEPHRRVQHWLDWLRLLSKDRLNDSQLKELTHGRRGEGDSLHLLMMNLVEARDDVIAQLLWVGWRRKLLRLCSRHLLNRHASRIPRLHAADVVVMGLQHSVQFLAR